MWNPEALPQSSHAPLRHWPSEFVEAIKANTTQNRRHGGQAEVGGEEQLRSRHGRERAAEADKGAAEQELHTAESQFGVSERVIAPTFREALAAGVLAITTHKAL